MSHANPSLCKTVSSLVLCLESYLNKGAETDRIARVATTLLITGCNRNNQLILNSENNILNSQQKDGGWIDTDETVWSLTFLKEAGHGKEESLSKGVQWLHAQQNPDSGWGRTNRDMPRIPITGLLLYLLPELSDSKAISWLTDEWRKDLESDTRLTYKGGFFLLGLSASKVPANDCPLIEETYTYLFEEQNEDGGFGPWKDHPIGSDPWSTGIVLLGLLSYPELVKRAVIEKTVNWLAETQLPNGLWSCHYIEEGSAYAYWGLVEALKYLSKEIG